MKRNQVKMIKKSQGHWRDAAGTHMVVSLFLLILSLSVLPASLFITFAVK